MYGFDEGLSLEGGSHGVGVGVEYLLVLAVPQSLYEFFLSDGLLGLLGSLEDGVGTILVFVRVGLL